MKYYKWFMADGSTPQVGDSEWSLPDGDTPGEWRECEGDLIPCENGLHACREHEIATWGGEVLYEVEVDGEVLPADDKVVCRRMRVVREVGRWTDRTAREFACDCAERALNREREQGREPDERSWAAIEVARRHARGEATDEELAAARAAAWGAARAAAWGAARDAAWAATWATAWAAAWGAARAAERAWQSRRIFEVFGE